MREYFATSTCTLLRATVLDGPVGLARVPFGHHMSPAQTADPLRIEGTRTVPIRGARPARHIGRGVLSDGEGTSTRRSVRRIPPAQRFVAGSGVGSIPFDPESTPSGWYGRPWLADHGEVVGGSLSARGSFVAQTPWTCRG